MEEESRVGANQQEFGEELREALAALPAGTMSAKLGRLMGVIQEQLKRGVQHAHIVGALNEYGNLGRELSLRNFRMILYRYRRQEERKGEGRKRGLEGRPTRTTGDLTEAHADSTAQERGPRSDDSHQAPRAADTVEVGQTSSPIISRADLRRIRMQPIDLDEMANYGREEKE
jgi:hypothetical protein